MQRVKKSLSAQTVLLHLGAAGSKETSPIKFYCGTHSSVASHEG